MVSVWRSDSLTSGARAASGSITWPIPRPRDLICGRVSRYEGTRVPWLPSCSVDHFSSTRKLGYLRPSPSPFLLSSFPPSLLLSFLMHRRSSPVRVAEVLPSCGPSRWFPGSRKAMNTRLTACAKSCPWILNHKKMGRWKDGMSSCLICGQNYTGRFCSEYATDLSVCLSIQDCPHHLLFQPTFSS